MGIGVYGLLSQESSPESTAAVRVEPLVGLGQAGLCGVF